MRKTTVKNKVLAVLTETETLNINENRTADGAKVFTVQTTLKEINAELFKKLLSDFYLVGISYDNNGLIFDITDENPNQNFSFDTFTNW